MYIDWDDAKSLKLKCERGLSLEEVSTVFQNGYVARQRSDDPEQYAAIGFAQGSLVTVIFEYRWNEGGEFIWLVTYWKATKAEVLIYAQSQI